MELTFRKIVTLLVKYLLQNIFIRNIAHVIRKYNANGSFMYLLHQNSISNCFESRSNINDRMRTYTWRNQHDTKTVFVGFPWSCGKLDFYALSEKILK